MGEERDALTEIIVHVLNEMKMGNCETTYGFIKKLKNEICHILD